MNAAGKADRSSKQQQEQNSPDLRKLLSAAPSNVSTSQETPSFPFVQTSYMNGSIDDYDDLREELLDCLDEHAQCEDGGNSHCLAKFNRCALRMLEESASREPIQ